VRGLVRGAVPLGALSVRTRTGSASCCRKK